MLAGGVGAVMAERADRVNGVRPGRPARRGYGFGGGLLITVAIALAGGPIGTGRMADIGAPLGEVLVSAAAAMSLGGLLGGVATAWWQRARLDPGASAAA